MKDDLSRTRSPNVYSTPDDRLRGATSTWRENELPYWQDLLSTGLGGLLFAMPWIQGITSHETSSWNAWIVGTLCALLGLVALALGRNASARIPNVLLLLAGVWLCISPWILGFGTLNAAVWAACLIGAALIIVNAWKLVQTARPPSMSFPRNVG